jgi:adenylate cyclase
LTGRYEEAIAAYRKAIAANHNWRDAHVGLASSYAILGQWDEARAEVSEILRIEPNCTIGKYEKLMPHQIGLETEIEGLRKAGLPKIFINEPSWL